MVKRAWYGLVGALLLSGLLPAWIDGAEVGKPKDPAEASRWSDLTPLVIHTPFDSFRYPHLDGRGNVTFITDDAYSRDSKGGNHGIFRYAADGSLVCLVRGGETTVPGMAATLHTIQGLQMDENGVDFIFNAYDTAKGRGLYRWTKGTLETVARTGDTILPGGSNPISSVEYGSLHGNHVLYKATSPGLGAVLVLHDLANEQDRVLCHAGMPIPGRKDETFQSVGNTNWVSADSVVFRASSAENPRGGDAKGKSGIYGWFGIKDWSTASGDFAPERLRAVVDGTASVPIAGVPGESTFDTIGSAPISGNCTAFEASGEGYSGIFTARTPDGPIRCVVSSRTDFDGPFKGRFTSFGSYPAVIGQNVIFTAEATEGGANAEGDEEGEEDDGAADAKGNAAPKTYRGVFIYRLDRGELFTLTDNRAPLVGKEIAGYEIGGHFLVGDRFAITVTFEDKSSQIFLGKIRPEAYKRLTEGAPKKAVPVP